MRGFAGISACGGTDFLPTVHGQWAPYQTPFGLWQKPAPRTALYTLLFPLFVKYLLSALARAALAMPGWLGRLEAAVLPWSPHPGRKLKWWHYITDSTLVCRCRFLVIFATSLLCAPALFWMLRILQWTRISRGLHEAQALERTNIVSA